MSRQFLLDGYNIIHKMPGALPDKLEDQRRFLIRYIETRRPQGSLRNRVTVVFDGQAGMVSRETTDRVTIVFSKDETADDLIKRMAGSAANPKDIVVVSDDRDIQYAVRASGASVSSVSDFMGFTGDYGKTKHSRNSRSRSTGGAKYISKSFEAKVNAELEDVWIKKKKRKKQG